MPHLGSMPDPKEKTRTLLAGWISRLNLALELGLSVDTLRRWDSAGKLETTRDDSDRRRVPVSEIERLRPAPSRPRPFPEAINTR